MNSGFTLEKEKWNSLLVELLQDYQVYAPFLFGEQIEYAAVNESNAADVIYNRPKPASPLKTLFLPIRENLFAYNGKSKRVIIGVPSCDLSALSILDEIYLDKDYIDPTYSRNRNNTILIGTDCHSINEHCHCTTYGFKPYPEMNADLILNQEGDNIILESKTKKGDSFRDEYIHGYEHISSKDKKAVENRREAVVRELKEKNSDLPDYSKTGSLIGACEDDIWKKYSETCVSCGACSAICPTCSCFLFIERPEFEKVRSIDTCQYPGFERVAAGEDPLRPLQKRFRNRYMCKYVWKPLKFESKACTGCGRCIEACIGEINKNELFRELTQNLTVEV